MVDSADKIVYRSMKVTVNCSLSSKSLHNPNFAFKFLPILISASSSEFGSKGTMKPAHHVSMIPRSCRIVFKDRRYPKSLTTSPRFQGLHQSTRTFKDSSKTSPSSSLNASQQAKNPSDPSFNLLQQIREARPAVRYTVYAGVGLMATAESTFWFNVIKAKYFPSASQDVREKGDEFLDNISSAVKGFRKVWMRNYGRYCGAYLWGLGYGGLDGLEDERQ
ncbi:uncharacterized protein K460DRAFT_36927 [Cucurbitaria berberidis CBS 394.84]|uniref:Uncharacterized protein n=1 Tax=Cucurbitaria berberidis CBS 394.84 TaxID=1168544 RepID=A0A9P4LE70_9PLEO|nr:uncharacterized protein K460DRAFT_36927 [Cucurbitaria berberidis CBS 394.84]KAF1851543.1 hypothetical protein K460DRAFT_36927 [Cucurbitaria berberidis CBS 394.84]